MRQGRQGRFRADQRVGQQVQRVAARGIQERHTAPSRHRQPGGRGREHQQRPRHPPARTTGGGEDCPAKGLDDCHARARDQHPASQRRLHGRFARVGRMVLGGLHGTACRQRLQAVPAQGQERRDTRLCAPKRQREVQGFRTRKGAQPDRITYPADLGETASRTGKAITSGIRTDCYTGTEAARFPRGRTKATAPCTAEQSGLRGLHHMAARPSVHGV